MEPEIVLSVWMMFYKVFIKANYKEGEGNKT